MQTICKETEVLNNKQTTQVVCCCCCSLLGTIKWGKLACAQARTPGRLREAKCNPSRRRLSRLLLPGEGGWEKKEHLEPKWPHGPQGVLPSPGLHPHACCNTPCPFKHKCSTRQSFATCYQGEYIQTEETVCNAIRCIQQLLLL